MPHLNTGVPAVEGGFETPLGRFDARWSFDKDSDGNDVLNVQITTPSETGGIVRLPTNMHGSFTRDGITRNVVLRGSAETELRGGTHALSWRADPGT